ELLAAKRALVEQHAELTAACEEVRSLEGSALPAARRAVAETREGYGRGAFAQIDVLDAERTLFDLELGRIDALAAYHRARIEIDRLVGAEAEGAFESQVPESQVAGPGVAGPDATGAEVAR